MRSFTATEARNRFAEILKIVQNGGQVGITYRGRLVARMIPERSLADVQEAVDGLLAIQLRSRRYAAARTPKDWETFKRWMRQR